MALQYHEIRDGGTLRALSMTMQAFILAGVIGLSVLIALASVCGILTAASILLFLVRAPLLRLIFLHGQMDEGGVERMASLLPYHLIGLAPFGALLVLARAHVATKNGGIMISMGVLNASSNVAFNLLLVRVLGLEGLALSTSCVHAVVALKARQHLLGNFTHRKSVAFLATAA